MGWMNLCIDKRTDLIFFGEAIGRMIISLPASQHPMSEAKKFCVDAWQSSGLVPSNPGMIVLYVSVHGEFLEGRCDTCTF